MYELRIPNLTAATTVSNAVVRNKEEYTRKMIQISDGDMYMRRSENPVKTEEAAYLNTTIEINSQWKENLKVAESWEKITDSTNQSILSTMHRVNELVSQANSGLNSSSDRDAIVSELNAIIESLVQFGNTEYQGESLYAGTATCYDKSGNLCDDPFTVDRDSDGNITEVYFLGNNDPNVDPTTKLKSVSVSDSASISYGAIGEGSTSLFKFQHYENTGTEAAPVWENVNVRLFDELVTLRDTLANTTDNPDPANMERIQAGLDNVIQQSVSSAANQTRITSSISNIDNIISTTTNRISDIQDVDETVAITELYQIEASLQASMQMINRLNNMSILNFIN